MFPYFYFVGCLLWIFLWLIIFITRKDLRRQILFMSLVIIPAGPLSEVIFYFKDYWNPVYIFGLRPGIEDILFAFVVGGVGSTIYQFLARKKLIQTREKNTKESFLIFLFGMLILFISFFGFGLNSIYASILCFLGMSFVVVVLRRDLLINAIISGGIMGLFAFFWYSILLVLYPNIFTEYWFLHNLSNIYIFNVPIEEILWFSTWGMISGPAYAFYRGAKFKSIRDS